MVEGLRPLQFMRSDSAASGPRVTSTGRLLTYDSFESDYAQSRRIDVWLPPGYESEAGGRFPVVYAHDGQNLFDSATSYAGVAWGLDEAVVRLGREARVPGAIVVGIWNSSDRIPEYMPQRALAGARYEARRARFASRYGREPVSDAYLRFIVEELKPKIDQSYRTMSDAGATVMLGSSMGGLVSIYGLCEYPDVFGGAACLSTSWTVGGGAVLEYLEERVPEPGRHRVYFDHGDEAQIARYEQIQRQADLVFARRGYLRNVDWMSIHFPGEDHSETAWRGRVDLPLRFLLARPTG